LLRDPTLEAGASLGFVASLALLLGGMVYHPLVFFLLPLASVYAIVYARRAPRERVRTVLVLALCAAALTAPRWLPILEWEWRNPRMVPGRGGVPLAGIAQMLLFPVADYKLRVPWGGSGVWEYWSYVGLVAGALAIASLRRGGPARTLAASCFVLALLLAWRGPWGSALGWIAPHVPFLASVRLYSRFLVLAVFAVALSAGRELAALRAHRPGLLAWAPVLLLAGVVGDYWLVTRPIWSRVFELPPGEVYDDWPPVPEVPYATVRSAPPYQPFTATQEMFNSRMLPLVMAGAVARNAYVTPALPWPRPAEGSIVEGLAPGQHRITNHELELFDDFRAGQEIRIKLRHSTKHWKVVDPTSARLDAEAGGMKLVILRPCPSVRIVFHSWLERAAWTLSVAGLIATALAVRRRPDANAALPS